MTTPRDSCRRRRLALIDFARREGWEVRLTGGRLKFCKTGLAPIFTAPTLNVRALLEPSSEDDKDA